MNDTVFIYGLNDPRTGRCRYVGKSVNPKARFKRHLFESGRTHAHKGNWIFELTSLGLRPVLEVLDKVPQADWQFWEREYIRVFRLLGMDLTNTTDGGSGPTQLGKRHSTETLLKQRLAKLGKPVSEEARRKIGDANRGREVSLETREKLSLAGRGRRHTPNELSKMSSAQLGRKHSPESLAKIRLAAKSRVWTEEQREKIRESNRRRAGK